MAIKANNDIQGIILVFDVIYRSISFFSDLRHFHFTKNPFQVSRVEIQSSPSVAAAAIAVGAAVVLLLTALAVVTGEFNVFSQGFPYVGVRAQWESLLLVS